MIDGVFVGLTTIDIVYKVAGFPLPNTKVAARSQDVFVGGPATNAAIAFRSLGGRASLVSAVGRHAIAAVVREEFERYSVNFIDLSPDFDGLPALSSVAVDPSGRRNVISANASRIPVLPPPVEVELCQKAKVLLVDGHAMDACQAWARAAREAGTPVVLDGGSWKDGTEHLLQSVDVAICSADFRAPGCDSESELIVYLKECGVTKVAITHGAERVRYFAPEGSGYVEVPPVNVVDTMGAGDIFHGAFCWSLANGEGFIESLSLAAVVASESCRFPGTRQWMEHLTPTTGH